MRILVTGGAGFIGSHAVRELLDQRHEVVVIDDLSHGLAAAVRAAGQAVPFIQANIGDIPQVEMVLRRFQIEAVLHFAAFIEVGESMVQPEIYYENNFAAALRLLTSMKNCGVKKIVFSSTAAIYGNPTRTPILEDAPRQPINPYGRSKMMTELALEDFARAHGFAGAILRYFNVAGAHPDGSLGESHQPETHLIPRILLAAQDPQFKLQIFGTDYPTADGTCVRDYIHVLDLVRAHALALSALQGGEVKVFNLGSEQGYSVREVLLTCEQVLGRKIPCEYRERRPGDPAVLIASSAKVRRELGWTRQYADLEQIVQHAWKWIGRKRA